MSSLQAIKRFPSEGPFAAAVTADASEPGIGLVVTLIVTPSPPAITAQGIISSALSEGFLQKITQDLQFCAGPILSTLTLHHLVASFSPHAL